MGRRLYKSKLIWGRHIKVLYGCPRFLKKAPVRIRKFAMESGTMPMGRIEETNY